MHQKTIPVKHRGRSYRIQVVSSSKTKLGMFASLRKNISTPRSLPRLFTWTVESTRRARLALPTLRQAHRFVFHIGLMLAMGLFALLAMQGVAYAHSVVAVQTGINHAHDKPVRVSFSRPIRGDVHYTWQESIEGSWQKEQSLTGVRALVFTPKKPLTPGSVLHLQLKKVQPAANIMSKTPSEYFVPIVVERAARIASQKPASNAQNVRVNTEVSLKLTTTNRGLRAFELSGDIPVVSKKPTTKDDITFTWKLAGELVQGKTYRGEVRDTQQPAAKQVIAVYVFSTVAEPSVSTNVSGYIGPNQAITLDFDQDMVQDNSAVVFAMPGKGAWESARRYSFTTSLVVPGTAYTYKAVKGAVSANGGKISEDRVFTAQTPGAVRVIGAQPSGSRIALNAPVKLTFDQAVDRVSAQNAFSISPQVNGSFAWSGNTMIFTPAGYGYQTNYTYGVAPGIKPVFGLTGVGYSNQFTSAYEVRKLGVPFFRQAHALSCEAASLRMALAYYGVSTNDDEILGRIGYAPQPRDTATNTWQDPNVEFVGDVDGKLSVTGWGVYAVPVARTARSFGRSADVIYSPSSASVASAIHAGRPVIMWGVMGMAAVDDSWNTATSGVVHAAKNQHVRLVYGVEGSADNPVGFYLHDPIRGSVYLSAGALQASMNGGGRQILVVY